MGQVVTTPSSAVLPFFLDGGVDSELSAARSAHVKKDLNSKELLVFGYQFEAAPYLVYGVADADGNLKTGPVHIHLPEPVMMHDFAATEHYRSALQCFVSVLLV